jgi:hypothetical protein
MMAVSKLVSGIVNRDKDHILLVYGDANQVDPEDFAPVALIQPCPGGFTVQYILDIDDTNKKRMIEEVQEEITYFNLDKGEPDPWAYAKYHCATAANWYSPVHWIWYPGKPVHSPSYNAPERR